MTVVKLKQACWDRSLAVGGTKAELLKRLRTPGNANGRNAASKVKRKHAAGKRTQSNALKTDIVIVDGGSSEDFVQTRPARTRGDDGNSGCQDRSETTPNRPNEKARVRTKPKYGRTPATFTELDSEGKKKKTPDGLDSNETKLYWTLMNWRRKLADSSIVDSYWILPNQTLYGLVEASRNDTFLLSGVSGLGGEGTKRTTYGAAIIDILHKHHTKNPR
jgi:hypothetical protein